MHVEQREEPRPPAVVVPIVATPAAVAAAAASGDVRPLPPRLGPARLDDGHLLEVFRAAGFPADVLVGALQVVRGGGSCPDGESGGDPRAVNGRYLGLWQLDPMWFEYAGEDLEQYADPLVNSRVAWRVILYDRATGGPDFRQWQCQP